MAKKYTLPVFLEVLVDGEQVFKSFQDVLDDPELWGQVVNKVLAEVEAWRDQYADLLAYARARGDRSPGALAAAKLVRTIDRVRREMGPDWPTLPDDVLRDE